MTKPSYKKIFKINSKFGEENDKLKNQNLYLYGYLGFLEESNKSIKLEITGIRNSRETSETCDSLKKEIIGMHDTLDKFTKGKENLDLILSS